MAHLNRSPKMKSLPKIAIVSAAGVAAVAGWFFTRPVIVVTGESPLWASEYDAFRQGSIRPGPGVPKDQLQVGERLRVIWTAEGKDYLVVCVVRGDFERGWLLLWQPGIASAEI